MAAVDEKVKQIIVEQLGVDEGEVTPSASFVDDLGADSLDTVELVMAFEEAFDIEIPDEDAEKIRTVTDAIDYIGKHAQRRASNLAERIFGKSTGSSRHGGTRPLHLGSSAEGGKGSDAQVVITGIGLRPWATHRDVWHRCSPARAASTASPDSTPPLLPARLPPRSATSTLSISSRKKK